MLQYYFLIFFLSLFISLLFTLIMIKTASWLNIVDIPDKKRKIHKANTPLLGGVAIFAAFFILMYLFRFRILAGNLEASHWQGVFIGACFLVIGGWLDDKYDLKPKHQVIFPVLAVVAVIAGGVSIAKISNPFGGFIYLQSLSAILIFFWLMGMMYTTKLLDGLDGLVAGITAIGGAIIFLFTMTTKYYQPDIGLAALVLSGVCLGFLIFNWHPARIFLGEGGSMFLGYILGVLAIISGGKIAIALLVMGIPIMDVAWTIIRRLREGNNPFKFADRKHLHFRLLDLGLSVRQAVIIFYLLAIIFGLSTLFLQTKGKIFALIILLIIMLAIIIKINNMNNKEKNIINNT